MDLYVELEKCGSLEWLDEDYDNFGISYYLMPLWLKVQHPDNQGTEKRSNNVIKTVYSMKDWTIKEAYLGIINDDKKFHHNFKIILPDDNHIPVHSGIKINEDCLEAM